MLNIITSSFCAPGHDRIKGEILKRVNDGQRVIMIVPEQQTVLAEAEMADFLPSSAPLNFEVTNFTRLANSTARALGGISGEYCDKTKKSLLMWQALSELSPMLSTAVSKQINEGLVARYLNATAQLSAFNISAEELEEAANAEKLQDSRLKAKLVDLCAVYSLYKRLVNEKYADTSDDCRIMLDKLRANPDYLKGSHVYLEGFTSFTEPQYAIIGELSGRLSLTALLEISKVCENSFEYTEVRNAIERLKRVARLADSDVRIFTEATPKNPESQISRSADLLWRNYGVSDNLCLQNSEEIRIFEADTPYDECDFVASDIRRRVMRGDRYSDFAIVARNVDKYAGILDAALLRESIPAFISKHTDLSSFEAIKLIYTAYAAVRSGFSRESVISYAKCSPSGISRDECDELEYYAEKWQISGPGFTDGRLWNMNPDGYSTVWRDSAKEKLVKINKIRERLISPLCDFSKAILRAKTVEDHAKLLVDFLKEIRLPDSLAKKASELEAMGEVAYAMEISKLWKIICDSLDTMVEVAGSAKACAEDFLGQLKICFANVDIAKIPAFVDEVTVGSADMLRLYGRKHVYLIGVNAGEFPGSVAENSYFTEKDKEILAGLGLSFTPELETKGARELYIFTRAYTYATESVTLSYSVKDTKYKAKKRDGVITRLISLFGESLEIKKICDLSATDLVWSSESAINNFARVNASEKKALEEALISAGEGDTVEKIKQPIANGKINLDPSVISSDTRRPLSLTQSRIDTFNNCPLSYFCRYTLKLSPEEVAEFDARNIGTFIHAILENAFSEVVRENIDTGALSKEERVELTERAAKKYLNELGEDDGASNMTKIKLSRLLRATVPIVDGLCDEFASSGFKPKFFELAITESGDDTPDPIKMTSPHGREVRVFGFIDRVDTYKKDGDVYVRVVDYKTGAKKFSPDDIAKGKNLQMFLYLKSIIDSENPEFLKKLGVDGRLIPAGVIYQKTSLSDTRIDYPDDSLAKEAVRAAQGREGMVLDNPEILNAMGLEYTPVYDSKNPDKPSPRKSNLLFTEQSLDALMDEAILAVGNAADGITGGNIKAEPRVEKGGATSCESCDFKPICRAAVIK